MMSTLAFISPTIDAVLLPILKAAGAALVLWSVFKSLKDFASGQVTAAVKRVLIFTAIAAVMFSPDLLLTLINGLSGTVGKLFSGLTEILGGSGGSTPTGGAGA